MLSNERDGRLSTVRIGNGPIAETGVRRQYSSFIGTGRIREDLMILMRGVRNRRRHNLVEHRETEAYNLRSDDREVANGTMMPFDGFETTATPGTISATQRVRHGRDGNFMSRSVSFLDPALPPPRVSRRRRRGAVYHRQRAVCETEICDDVDDVHGEDMCADHGSRHERDVRPISVTHGHGHGNVNSERVVRQSRGPPQFIRRAVEFENGRAIRDSLSEWEAMCQRAEEAMQNGNGEMDCEEYSDNEGQFERVGGVEFDSRGDGDCRRDAESFGSRRTASFSSFTECLGL